MAAAEQRDQQLFDHLILTDDHLRELLQNFFAGLVELTHGRGVVAGARGLKNL